MNYSLEGSDYRDTDMQTLLFPDDNLLHHPGNRLWVPKYTKDNSKLRFIRFFLDIVSLSDGQNPAKVSQEERKQMRYGQDAWRVRVLTPGKENQAYGTCSSYFKFHPGVLCFKFYK